MAKNIRKLIIQDENVLIEFNDQHQIQFCKRCSEQGQHMREFIAYFAPELRHQSFKTQSLTYLEQQYYHLFAKRKVPRFVKYELHSLTAALMERAQRRSDNLDDKEDYILATDVLERVRKGQGGTHSVIKMKKQLQCFGKVKNLFHHVYTKLAHKLLR